MHATYSSTLLLCNTFFINVLFIHVYWLVASCLACLPACTGSCIRHQIVITAASSMQQHGSASTSLQRPQPSCAVRTTMLCSSSSSTCKPPHASKPASAAHGKKCQRTPSIMVALQQHSQHRHAQLTCFASQSIASTHHNTLIDARTRSEATNSRPHKQPRDTAACQKKQLAHYQRLPRHSRIKCLTAGCSHQNCIRTVVTLIRSTNSQ